MISVTDLRELFMRDPDLNNLRKIVIINHNNCSILDSVENFDFVNRGISRVLYFFSYPFHIFIALFYL